jgi:thiol-disulfide isomerase/thioredoxin
LGFELSNGDQFYGKLLAIEENKFHVDTVEYGVFVFDSSLLRRVFRWNDGASGTFVGPGPLSQWDTRGNEAAWQDRGGQLGTSTPLASIRRDIGLANRSRVELELSWSDVPNFTISLGTQLTDESARQAFRIEVWDSSFVLLRELDEMAEVVSIGATHQAKGQLRLAIDLDQTNNHAIVYSDTGVKLADLKLGSETSAALPGFHLENLSGNIRIDSLRVFNSGGPLAASTRQDVVASYLDDGQLAMGNWIGLQDGKVLASFEGTESSIPIEQLVVTHWPILEEQSSEASSEKRLRVITHGTMRITGAITSVTADAIHFAPALFPGNVIVPVAQVRALQNLVPVPNAQASEGRRGSLELSDMRASGVLLPAVSSEQSSCLRFAPTAMSGGATLLHGANGRMVYRVPDAPKQMPEQQQVRAQARQQQQQGLVGAMFGAFAGGSGGAPSKRLIHLRNGDIVPAQVTRIDESGVLIESEVAGDQLIPNSEIKAIEINGNAGAPSLEDAKRQRLLTVPRIRKKSPPHHLLVSTNGDYLRGNIVSLDKEKIVVENRLETIEVLRRNVAKVIFFHDDELEMANGSNAAIPPSDPSSDPSSEPSSEPTDKIESNAAAVMQVQAIQRDGIRLTFVPREVGGDELVGDSPLLGVCLVDLKTADAILFGAQIKESMAELAYHQWRLSHAPEPKVLDANSSEGEGGRMAGTSSPLVGTDAPDFKLKMLDGSIFQLQEHQGKIIVLDFWATWCGPCMQAMPQIDEAVAYFSPDDVMLVAVNLQETPEDIRSTLDRLKLNPAVALDIDGVAASRYQADAIPQTVVIDRDGKIQRLFVGGGPKLKEQLQTAIADLIEPPAEQKFPEMPDENTTAPTNTPSPTAPE